MPVVPPPGFILLNGRYILVRVTYCSPNEQEPVPNYEYQRIIEPVLCDIGNAIGALPIPTDAFSVTVPEFGDTGKTMDLRCEVRLRYFDYPNELASSLIVDGIEPDLVVYFIVDGNR